MTPIVWLPLLIPFLAVPAARRVAAALEPGRAVRLLTTTAVGLAAGSVAALLLLVVPGASYLPVVAALGELTKPLTVGPPSVAVAISVAAAGLLAWRAVAVVAALHRLRADLRRARLLVDGGDSELVVLQDGRPDAYALPGRPGRPGRIVVTTGMLGALDPDEREALFAHERAHLSGRHHLLLGAAELAALCHPALIALREPLGYALERAADEAAVEAVGDRRLVGRAIGRAALAGRTATATRRPLAALAAAAGPVPRRVAALLGRTPDSAPRTTGTCRFVAAALLACLALSGASAIGAADSLHSTIEIAQGEHPHD
ncbi:M48 family metalloprotease [Streptomyces sp. NBC_01537]|uniref:M48 family metalloprotease n=1 Tax=Streptomyces sp. NBC_01537 TaxID=2903896 RepID=UPI0038631E30